MLLRQACWSHCNLLLRQAHFNLDLHNRETMTLANCLCSKKFLKCTMFSMRNYNKQQRWHYQLTQTYKHTQSYKETVRLWHVWPACHQKKLGPGRLIELKYTLWNVDRSHFEISFLVFTPVLGRFGELTKCQSYRCRTLQYKIIAGNRLWEFCPLYCP